MVFDKDLSIRRILSSQWSPKFTVYNELIKYSNSNYPRDSESGCGEWPRNVTICKHHR